MQLICYAGCFLPFSHWGEKICLFYSWVSFGVWKGKIDSAPVGCQWRSDPEKERGEEEGERQPERFLGSANHFSSHLSASLWALTHTDPHLTASDWNSSTRQDPVPPSSPSARHTPRGIQNALTPNQWETVKKAKKKKKEKNLLSNII